MTNKNMIHLCRFSALVLVCVSGFIPAGCAQPSQRIRLDPVSMREAVGIVNDNQAKITRALRASGSADGYFETPEGRRRHFSLDATLFYIDPIYLRFDLKKFGDRQMLFGSNQEWYWSYEREDETYSCGRHGDPVNSAQSMPILPQQFIEAMGLAEIHIRDGTPAIQRVVDDYQQLLFVAYDENGLPRIDWELWIDRYAPRLIRKVVFRDARGVIELEASLSKYEQLGPTGPWLPTLMVARRPSLGVEFNFRVSRWKFVDQVKRDSPQFTTPRECDDR